MTKQITFPWYREENDIETAYLVSASVTVVPPWHGPASNCPSDADYYGHTEVADIYMFDAEGLEVEPLPGELELLEEKALEIAKEPRDANSQTDSH